MAINKSCLQQRPPPRRKRVYPRTRAAIGGARAPRRHGAPQEDVVWPSRYRPPLGRFNRAMHPTTHTQHPSGDTAANTLHVHHSSQSFTTVTINNQALSAVTIDMTHIDHQSLTYCCARQIHERSIHPECPRSASPFSRSESTIRYDIHPPPQSSPSASPSQINRENGPR